MASFPTRAVLLGALLSVTSHMAPAAVPTPLDRPQPIELTEAERAEIDRRTAIRGALAAARTGDLDKARSLAGIHPDPALRVAAEWLALRSVEPRFEAIDAFLSEHPTWPDRARLLRLAELDMFRREPEAAKVAAHFAAHPAQSDHGRRAHARALIDLGRPEDANAEIAGIYRELRMSAREERAFLAVYGPALGPRDHGDRATYQLYFERVQAAERAVARGVAPHVRTRVALCAATIRKSERPKLDAEAYEDPHVAHCLAERSKPLSAARHLARVSGDGDAIGPRSRWTTRRAAAREMLDAGRPALAYRVAARHGIAAPAQAAEAEAMAGWIALRGLNEPAKALAHFETLDRLATRPITRARAAYWLGRTHAALGAPDDAEAAYRAAAQEPTTYYGQLALATLGEDTLRLRDLPRIAAGTRIAFDNMLAVRAARLLAAHDETRMAASLAASLANTADAPHVTALGARLVAAIADPKAQVGVGKRAAYRGQALDRYAFPTHDAILAGGEDTFVETPVLLGVARQESLFDEDAGSHVGARGLMQLMPGTAREVSGQLGLRYTRARLTQDPAYNVRLGSAYLEGLDRRFDGSQPMMFAGYNAGPGRVNQWVRRYGDPRRDLESAVDWIERIPFEETRNYVMRVMENVGVYRARLAGGAAPLTIETDLQGRARPYLRGLAAARVRKADALGVSPLLLGVSAPADVVTLPPLPPVRIARGE